MSNQRIKQTDVGDPCPHDTLYVFEPDGSGKKGVHAMWAMCAETDVASTCMWMSKRIEMATQKSGAMIAFHQQLAEWDHEHKSS